ncbi:MAG: hypothetical protein WC526_01075 [Patescibacteria group bacterium]
MLEKRPYENSIPLVGQNRPSFAVEKVVLGQKREARECLRRCYEYRDSKGEFIAQGLVDVNAKPFPIESPDPKLGFYNGWKLESFIIISKEGKKRDVLKNLNKDGQPLPDIVIDDLVEQCGYINEPKKMIVVPPLKSAKEIEELVHENMHAQQDNNSHFKPLLDLYEWSEMDAGALGEAEVEKRLREILRAVSHFGEAKKFAKQLKDDVTFFEGALRSGKVPASEVPKMMEERVKRIQKMFSLPMQICEIDAEDGGLKGLEEIKETIGADFLAPFIWTPSVIADTPHSRALDAEEENRFEVLGTSDLYEQKKKFEHGKPSVTSVPAIVKMYLESVGALPAPWEKG